MAVFSYFQGLTVEERVHEWVDFSLRDAPQGPEDIRELLVTATALRRLGVDPVAILRAGQGAQDPESVAAEVSVLRKIWRATEDDWDEVTTPDEEEEFQIGDGPE